jgi:SAM-dependent methyltransferase
MEASLLMLSFPPWPGLSRGWRSRVSTGAASNSVSGSCDIKTDGRTRVAGGTGSISKHYGSAGIAGRLIDALRTSGVDVDHLTPQSLYAVDQLHARDLSATADCAARLGLDRSSHVLDVGSGVGGPARYVAATFGCRVTGIDITHDFVEAARTLTSRVGLGDLVTFEEGSALAMPFADGSFDAALCLYVAMNIADKAGLAREIRRTLRPGGRLVWSEVTLGPNAPPAFPLPWARMPADSALVDPESLKMTIDAAGFSLIEFSDETDIILAHIDRGRKASVRPPIDMSIVMGADFAERRRNYADSLASGAARSHVALAIAD